VGRYIYAATPGENWSWKWIEVTHNMTLSEGQISYVGGETYCWSSGTCGAVAAWGIGISARCFDETEHRVELYHNGALVGAHLGLYRVIEDNSLHFRFLPKSEPIQ